MSSYLKLFKNHSQYEDYVASGLTLPIVSHCIQEAELHYNLPHDYSQDYLTFETLEDGTFTFTNPINYSTDEGATWTELAANTPSPTVSEGSKIMWRAEITPGSSYPSFGIGTFSSTGNFNVEGNAMSLLYGDDFVGKTSLEGKNYAFRYLFSGCTKAISAENLSLPATTLASGCYSSMFYGCTSLTTAPQLPATELASECYSSMFRGCTNLTTAPQLPATTLANYCYYGMFTVCTSLTTAPELLATTLASNCYNSMFQGCISLTTAPELPATTLADSCYYHMFYDCESLTTAPELPATTLAGSCYNSMFLGCTNLTIAPELPATTLASNCYQYMFNGCTSLTIALELPATTLANNCYQNMFNGCTSLTAAPQLPATTLASGCYGYMFYGCTSLTTAPQLPATTLVSTCYNYMFYGCTSLNYIKAMFTTIPGTTYTKNWVSGVAASGTFVKNSAATWDVRGVDGIPTGWTVQTASA